LKGEKHAEQAARQELVNAYWQVGRRIWAEELTENAGYGDSVIEDLAGELDIHPRTLWDAVVFFDRYKILSPRVQNLSWAHLRALSRLPDEKERIWYEQQATLQDWTRNALVRAIQRDAFSGAKDGKKKSVRLKRPSSPFYTYKGEVERVIDGDTVVLERGMKVRLIGVDTPETVHPNKPVQRYGREASAFTKQLTEGVVVRLEYDQQRTDKYGRTLAYVYLSDGRMLNAEIVKHGYGHAYTKYPFKYMEEFLAYEREARESNRGLWAQ